MRWLVPDGLYEVAKVERKAALAAPGSTRGYLKRNRVEARVITLGVALYKGSDLIRCCHLSPHPDNHGRSNDIGIVH